MVDADGQILVEPRGRLHSNMLKVSLVGELAIIENFDR